MKHILLTTIAAVVLVGCGKSQQSAPTPETKPEPPTVEAPDIDIHEAARIGNIEAIKQHLAAGTDVNAKDKDGFTPLIQAVQRGQKEAPHWIGQTRGTIPKPPTSCANTAARRVEN